MRNPPSPRRPAYEATTRGFTVRVRPQYLPDQSDPERSRYVWAYTVEIENRGEASAQIVSRHWIITDARNRVGEVNGEGVVGEQPTLKAGEAFRYTSSCPLTTPSGAMRGSYQMLGESGETFDIEIPEFSLHLPDATRRMN
ncbi:MAG: Co2+/Mg2+ efflux protein ApaG [Caulobacteraceae bacterium]|nr:Co2+/Mg2+ efflux protein ApaG [Caulobacteraceae bacterium]